MVRKFRNDLMALTDNGYRLEIHKTNSSDYVYDTYDVFILGGGDSDD